MNEDERFVKRLRKTVRHHLYHNPKYRKIADAARFSAGDLKAPEDVPVITTLYFKRHDLNTHRGVYTARSSGTSGSVSEIRMTLGDIVRLFFMAVSILRGRGLFSKKRTNYVILGVKPSKTVRAQAPRTAKLGMLLAPKKSAVYAIREVNGTLKPDVPGVLASLRKYAEEDRPVRIIGFPSYAYMLMRTLQERNETLLLPKGSKMLIGGGWKSFEADAIDRETFRSTARETLGLSDDAVIEFFGAVEHPILYVDDESHRFRETAYSRVIIRDPKTFQPVPDGTPGIVNFVTPMFHGCPIHSVATDDIGIRKPDENGKVYFEILGRAGVSSIRTCVETANDAMKGERA